MYQDFKWTAVAEDRIAILKKYEPLQPYVLLELAKLNESDTFIDIGANIGVYSVFMSSLANVRTVHSFEPSPHTFNELSINTKINGAGKIRLYKTALSDSQRRVTFGIVSNYSGANSIIEESIHNLDTFIREETIDCIPLDSVGIVTSGKLCIKIDVEGHEKKVLAGAEGILTHNQTVLQMERYEQDSNTSELLTRFGYRRLVTVGPDCYYSNNDNLTCNDIMLVLERAFRSLIASNFANDRIKPLRITILPGVYLELSDAISSFARNAKRRLKLQR
jgi:FkbM family methyltransferase